ncbi:hypothetical protein Hte_007875 [Hypoxylon texense]
MAAFWASLNLADVNEPGVGGLTALHWAAKLGQIDMLKLLLFSADTNQRDDLGRTPLFDAVEAESGSDQIIDLLLKHNAKVNISDRQNISVLRLAVEKQNISAVKILSRLDHKTLFDVVADCSRECGVNDEDVTAMRVLVECGANVSVCTAGRNLNVLHVAADRGCLEVFRILKDSTELAEQREADGWTPLHIAAKRGWEDIVEFLLTHYSAHTEAKTNQGWTALHIAADNGHTKIAFILIDKGADVVATSILRSTPVYFACYSGHDETAFSLLETMTRQQVLTVSNDQRESLLWTAAISGCKRTVQKLLEYYEEEPAVATEVLSEIQYGCTFAYYAIARKDLFDTADIMALLTRYKASTEGLDGDNNTAFHWAAKIGRTEVVQYLLDDDRVSKDHAESTNSQGQTPAQCAAIRLYDDIVGLLLNIRDPQLIAEENTSGWVGIHWAAKYRRLDIIRLMVAQGTDISKMDSRGRTAADIARELDDESIEMMEIVEWLTPAERHDMDYSDYPALSRPELVDGVEPTSYFTYMDLRVFLKRLPELAV